MERTENSESYRRQEDPAWYRIVMLSAIAFAIEFAYSLETAYGTPVLLKSGLEEKYVPVMWAIGPVLGILFQGCMGSASDRCKCSWGKRRPFILGLAIVVCICAGLFPYGELLSGNVFHLSGSAHSSFVIAFTAVILVSMDFNLDMIQSPVRAYLLDSVPEEKLERGNSIYSSMVNIGATVGAVVASIPWKKLGLGGDYSFGLQVKVAFGMLVLLVIVTQLLTLCSVKERKHLTEGNIVSPEESPSDPKFGFKLNGDNQSSTDIKDLTAVSAENTKPDTINEPSSDQDLEVVSDEDYRTLVEKSSSETKCFCHCLKPSSWCADVYGALLFVKFMSFTFLRLWILVFFSWFAFLAMYIFFTTFVGEVVYGGSPTSEDKELRDSFDEGVIVGSAGLVALYLVAFIYSLLSERITRHIGYRPVVIGAHVAFLVSCGATVLYPTVWTAVGMTTMAGVYFSLLVNFPYAVIPYYKVYSWYP